MMNKHGGYRGNDLIDFSVNLNPIAKPDGWIEAFEASSRLITDYPEIDQSSFRRFLAGSLDCSEDELIIGNGATELIYLLAQSLDIETVGIFEPTYNEYRRAFELFGKTILSIPLPKENGFISSFKDLPDCDLYILCNPNNPTGTYIRDISGLIQRGALVLLDESFLDFVEDPVNITSEHVIHLRSLTKFYGLAGLRIGYLKAHPKVISQVRRFQPPWSVNAIALELMAPLMQSDTFKHQTHAWLSRERNRFRQALPGLIGGEANFFFFQAEHGTFEDLKRAGFYLRQCDDYVGLGPDYYRFCIHTPDKNIQLIETLKEIL